MHTTRISAVKIRVANFETHTTRIFAVKIRVANFEMHATRISAVKIRVANVKCEKNKWMSYISHGTTIQPIKITFAAQYSRRVERKPEPLC